MLPEKLNPKVWFLLIGTNDLGRSGCSKRTVLAGILQVAQFLHTKRPGTPILLHGLLPRNDFYADESVQTDFTLNRYWLDIVWINQELQRFCSLHHEWQYMDSGNLFLANINGNNEGATERYTNAAFMINKTVMADALHPNVAGYRVWGPLIVEHVLKLIPAD